MADSKRRQVAAAWGASDVEAAVGLGPDELDALLVRLHAEHADRPILVEVSDPDGDTLAVGVGQASTILSFVLASGDPPYLMATADPPATGKSIWFDFFGSESEFLPEHAIPFATARAVLRSFAATGDRSGVGWVEV